MGDQRAHHFGYIGYTIEWSYKVLIPSMLVYGLWKERNEVVIVSLLMAFAFFPLTSSKSALAYPIVVIAVYFAEKREKFARIDAGICCCDPSARTDHICCPRNTLRRRYIGEPHILRAAICRIALL